MGRGRRTRPATSTAIEAVAPRCGASRGRLGGPRRRHLDLHSINRCAGQRTGSHHRQRVAEPWDLGVRCAAHGWHRGARHWHPARGRTCRFLGPGPRCPRQRGRRCRATARILRRLNIRPRRTIRFAFWSGEEQGLLGSQAYLERHSGEIPRIRAVVNFGHGPRPRSALRCRAAPTSRLLCRPWRAHARPGRRARGRRHPSSRGHRHAGQGRSAAVGARVDERIPAPAGSMTGTDQRVGRQAA